MSDETTHDDAAAAQAADDASAQGGATDDAQDGAADDEQLSPEAARKLRSEAKNLRDRLRTAEADLQKRKDAELNDQQRQERDLTAAQARIEGLETETRTMRAQVAAGKVGIRTDAVEDAVKLLDWSTVDDPSDAKQVEKALRELVKTKPYLAGQQQDGLGGGRGRQTIRDGNPTDLIRGLAARRR